MANIFNWTCDSDRRRVSVRYVCGARLQTGRQKKRPAVRLEDGVDYVPMKKFKNALINLLNIAGNRPDLRTGSRVILFGPIAFITIPHRMCDQRRDP